MIEFCLGDSCFCWGDECTGSTYTEGGAFWAGPATSGLPMGSISGIVDSLMFWLIAILGFIAIIGFVISGILYLTAAGNDAQIKQAKEAMKWSIVGVIVALSGFVVIAAVYSWLTGTTTQF